MPMPAPAVGRCRALAQLAGAQLEQVAKLGGAAEGIGNHLAGVDRHGGEQPALDLGPEHRAVERGPESSAARRLTSAASSSVSLRIVSVVWFVVILASSL